MTIFQMERFYQQDKKKYDLSKNKDLLIWLKNAIKKGYHSFMDIDDLQGLIDNLVYWYEIKYPEREMEFYEGTLYYDFENIKPMSKYMDIQQLIFRLSHKQLCLMQCNYNSGGSGIRNIHDDNGNIIGQKETLFMPIKRKNIDKSNFNEVFDFLLYADCDDGNVHIDYYIKDIVETEKLTLDKLLIIFKKKCINDLDFTALEQCVYDHNCDIELRNMILQLVALKLLYSKNTIPTRGYERAKRFINEINKKLNINLTTEEIDEAFNRDYTNGKKGKKVLKTYTVEDGNVHYYWAVENEIKKPKPKRLIKSLFKKSVDT